MLVDNCRLDRRRANSGILHGDNAVPYKRKYCLLAQTGIVLNANFPMTSFAALCRCSCCLARCYRALRSSQYSVCFSLEAEQRCHIRITCISQPQSLDATCTVTIQSPEATPNYYIVEGLPVVAYARSKVPTYT